MKYNPTAHLKSLGKNRIKRPTIIAKIPVTPAIVIDTIYFLPPKYTMH